MGSTDPDGRSAINRRYYEAHKEDLRRKHRAYNQTYKRPSRAGKEDHPRVSRTDRRVSEPTPRIRKGSAIWRWAETTLKEQNGKCYLCEQPISLASEIPGQRRTAEIDHDHRCCKQGCRDCRRGLACSKCNITLGVVNDDLDRLDLIARNARNAWAQRGVL